MPAVAPCVPIRIERTWRGYYLRVTPRYATDFLPRIDGASCPPGGVGASGSWWPWPRLCQELRTQELAGVLWPTWRRFDPSSSPSASKSLKSQREFGCRQIARHSRRLASVFARIPNSERELLPILATNAADSQKGTFLVRFSSRLRNPCDATKP